MLTWSPSRDFLIAAANISNPAVMGTSCQSVKPNPNKIGKLATKILTIHDFLLSKKTLQKNVKDKTKVKPNISVAT
jgi:hypothetical protein